MEYVFPVGAAQDGRKLGGFLRENGVSCTLVRTLKYLDDGILVNGERAKTDRILRAGDTVGIRVPAKDSALPPCDVPVPVAYESRDVIVFDKPAGMATHPTLNQKAGTLANVYAALRLERGEAPDAFRPTNRLDRNTSGLVLAAKSRFGAEALAQSAHKVYLAVAEGVFEQESGDITAPIGRAEGSIIQRVVRPDGQSAHTHFEVLERLRGHTLLRVVTYTGRTHQIRVHLASIGHPLAGDTLYGGSGEWIGRHALHCAELTFREPAEGQEICLASPLPQDMQALVDRMKAKTNE